MVACRPCLYLASSPLHSFFSLGLMNGPLSEGEQTLAVIDRPVRARDYIAESIEAGHLPGVAVQRFAALPSTHAASGVLAALSTLSRTLNPRTIAVGNDRRIEFYAAVRGCPSARRIYLDDGLYSYLPHRDALPAWRESLSNRRRSLKYGLPLERPSLVGGSRAVQEAYVLLPQQVHAGLVGKPVHPFLSAWFTDPRTTRVCAAAAALAGVDAARCAGLGLLVLLPHPRFLSAEEDLAQCIAALVTKHSERGQRVALKPHPAAEHLPLREQLPGLTSDVMTLPATLPVEVLAPLLSGTLIVGTLTTALLTLRLLGSGLQVRSLVLPTSSSGESPVDVRTQAIYRSVGIEPISDQMDV